MREFRSDLPLFIAAFRDKPFSHKRLQGFCKIGLGSAVRNHVTEPDTPARVTDTFPKLHHLLERPTNQPAASFVQRLEQFLCPECEGTTHTLQRIQSVVFAPCLPKPFPDLVERELQQGRLESSPSTSPSILLTAAPASGRPATRAGSAIAARSSPWLITGAISWPVAIARFISGNSAVTPKKSLRNVSRTIT